MGFWGSLVLCRPGGDLGELDAIASRDESVTEVGRPGGDWRIGQGEDAALIDDAEAFLQDLVRESGAPALLGYVVDSDCVDVVALGTASGLWRSCLDRAAMQAYAEDGPLDDSILVPDAAAERAAAWAAEAGLQPDLVALRSVFSRTGDELLAEALFFQLVDALGVAGASAPAPTLPTKSRQRGRTRPSNPLDAFVFDYAAELLKSEGFSKRGRVFSRPNSRGDVAVVQFRSFPTGDLVSMQVNTGVAARPVAEFSADLDGHRPVSPGDMTWSCGWDAPRRPGLQWSTNIWSARDDSERESLGHALAETLRQEVVPTLVSLLDRATLTECAQDPGLLDGRFAMGTWCTAVSLLSEEGPSVALDQAMRALGEHPFHRAALAWVQARLAEQGYSDDGWRDGVWRCDTDPYVRLTAMLEAEVDAPMATAGFTRSGTQYRLRSDVGDYAIVEFTPLSGSAGSAVRFRVSSAVLPGPELDWRRAQAEAHPERSSGAIQVEARTGWLQTWHRPPAAHAVTGGPLPSLDAGLWTFTPDTAAACGAALVELLTAETIPRLRGLLDRAHLLTTVLDPATKAGIGYSHATIILLVDDDGESDQLEAALQREEAGQGPTEPELAAWARARAHENERS